jgi:Fe-S-cluster-containing hydrogenase component 2
MSIIVAEHRCPQNHPCPSVSYCPTGAIIQQGFNAPTIDEEKCVQCGKCLQMCPYGAFQNA